MRVSPAQRQREARKNKDEWDFSPLVTHDPGQQRRAYIHEINREIGSKVAPWLALSSSAVPDLKKLSFLAGLHRSRPAEKMLTPVDNIERYLAQRTATQGAYTFAIEWARVRTRKDLDTLAKEFRKWAKRERPPWVKPASRKNGAMADLWNLACYRLRNKFELSRAEALQLLSGTAMKSARPNLFSPSTKTGAALSKHERSLDSAFSQNVRAAREAIEAAPRPLDKVSAKAVLKSILSKNRI